MRNGLQNAYLELGLFFLFSFRSLATGAEIDVGNRTVFGDLFDFVYVDSPASSGFSVTVTYFISAHRAFAATAANSAHLTPPKQCLTIIQSIFRFGNCFSVNFLNYLRFFLLYNIIKI